MLKKRNFRGGVDAGLTNFSFQYIEEKRAVLVRIEGVYDPGTSLRLIDSSIASMSKYNCKRCLFDFRLGVFESSIIDIIHRSETAGACYDLRLYRVALVVREETDELKFLESSYRILGLDFRLFISEGYAMQWLQLW